MDLQKRKALEFNGTSRHHHLNSMKILNVNCRAKPLLLSLTTEISGPQIIYAENYRITDCQGQREDGPYDVITFS